MPSRLNPEQIPNWEGKARGTKVSLPHGGLPEVISPYMLELIESTGGPMGPIGLQFISQPDEEIRHAETGSTDPLIEDLHRVTQSSVVKYEPRYNQQGDLEAYGRMLWLVTLKCAMYCRYCTRGREVGTAPPISKEEADNTLNYLASHPDINEVILSGGDPLTLPPKVFDYIIEGLAGLQREGKIDVVRVGTRFPIHNPQGIPESHFESLKKIEYPRIMLHVNTASELTPEAIGVIQKLQFESRALIKSQSVLLNGVNYFEDEAGNPDSRAMYELFVKLARYGISPYYVFQNDEVYWAKHMTVPIKKAIEMWQQLRPKLSGDAGTARFVIDVENGHGKIAVPEGGSWSVNYDEGFLDFKGRRFHLEDGSTSITV